MLAFKVYSASPQYLKGALCDIRCLFQLLRNVKKYSFLDVAEILDPLLILHCSVHYVFFKTLNVAIFAFAVIFLSHFHW